MIIKSIDFLSEVHLIIFANVLFEVRFLEVVRFAFAFPSVTTLWLDILQLTLVGVWSNVPFGIYETQ